MAEAAMSRPDTQTDGATTAGVAPAVLALSDNCPVTECFILWFYYVKTKKKRKSKYYTVGWFPLSKFLFAIYSVSASEYIYYLTPDMQVYGRHHLSHNSI